MTDTDQSVVEELVGNAHGNLARVRELLDVHPAALNLRAVERDCDRGGDQMGTSRSSSS